jgi:hypothetical protein
MATYFPSIQPNYKSATQQGKYKIGIRNEKNRNHKSLVASFYSLRKMGKKEEENEEKNMNQQ